MGPQYSGRLCERFYDVRNPLKTRLRDEGKDATAAEVLSVNTRTQALFEDDLRRLDREH